MRIRYNSKSLALITIITVFIVTILYINTNSDALAGQMSAKSDNRKEFTRGSWLSFGTVVKSFDKHKKSSEGVDTEIDKGNQGKLIAKNVPESSEEKPRRVPKSWKKRGLKIGRKQTSKRKESKKETVESVKEVTKPEKEEEKSEEKVAQETKIKIVEEAPKTEAVEVTENIVYHEVKKGETLWEIAGDTNVYNDSKKWPLIYKANKDRITDPDKLKVGLKLVIPQQ